MPYNGIFLKQLKKEKELIQVPYQSQKCCLNYWLLSRGNINNASKFLHDCTQMKIKSQQNQFQKMNCRQYISTQAFVICLIPLSFKYKFQLVLLRIIQTTSIDISQTYRFLIIFYLMYSTENYLKWTGRLLEEFSSTGLNYSSTQSSFLKPQGARNHYLEQKQNQMKHYRRYADSLDIKRKNYAASQNLISYLSRLPFVQYTPNYQNSCCIEQHSLKKTSIRQNKKVKNCQYCKDKRQKRQEQKEESNNPIIVKQIERIYVPTPPIVIREFINPPNRQNHSSIILDNQLPQSQQIYGPRLLRVESQPGTASVDRVSFNYASGPNARGKIILADQKRPVFLSPNQKQISTPYKLLQFSPKKPYQGHDLRVNQRVCQTVEYNPRIVISPPQPRQIDQKMDANYRQTSKFGSRDDYSKLQLVDASHVQYKQSYEQLGLPAGSFQKGGEVVHSLHSFGKIQ